MKKGEHHYCSHMGWGFIVAAFGVFFLISNFLPYTDLLRYWPIFLIVAGVYKMVCCFRCDHKK